MLIFVFLSKYAENKKKDRSEVLLLWNVYEWNYNNQFIKELNLSGLEFSHRESR